MTVEEITTDPQSPTLARPGSPLACFGVNQSTTRLYFVGAGGLLSELQETPSGWQATGFEAPVTPDHGLACFGLGGVEPRVYFVELHSGLMELVHQNDQWLQQFPSGADYPASRSPLTCAGGGGPDGRLYYVGNDAQVHEISDDNTGNLQDQVLDGTTVAPGSGLTCKTDSNGLVMVFYVDSTDNLLHVLAEISPQDGGGIINDAIKGTDPAPGSALTCFNQEGTDNTRVYYLDRQNQINELAWNGSTQTNNGPIAPAMPGSALTCFAVEGRLTRVYYLDDNAQINELAWRNGGWDYHLTLWKAARDSALTCYGVNGSATRLYYHDEQYRVTELALKGDRFVNTPL